MKEMTVEVPVRALVDLLDLGQTAVEEMRTAAVLPALPDALSGAIENIRVAIFAPA